MGQDQPVQKNTIMEAIVEGLRKLLAEPETRRADAETRRIVVKDALIPYFLKFIYGHKLYRQLAFYGGSCARMVYGLNRMSEDIDLDNSAGLNLTNFKKDLGSYIRGDLQLKTGDVYCQAGDLIKRWTVRLPILFDLGLGATKSEKLHVKIEISGQPQTAKVIKTPVLRAGKTMVITHWDKETLMAGKMIACLERIWKKGRGKGISIKGRDYFDLIWYMQQQVKPLEEKLLKDAKISRNTAQTFLELKKKIKTIKPIELTTDLKPLFNEPVFVEEWVNNFKEFFNRYVAFYKTAA